ncbi:MAG: hypothetical protein AW07_04365 [Candidatus Accumulibacter sp. SK-11]|nr:MAG: hypothetical protein AW07_04365 [Candidatus Accumulibacter sp. SK-11]
MRLALFSLSPLRRAGFSITRTLTPRCCAATTAASSDGSENRNILIRIDFRAASMASTIGWPVSSGRTMRERCICDGLRKLCAGCKAPVDSRFREIAV